MDKAGVNLDVGLQPVLRAEILGIISNCITTDSRSVALSPLSALASTICIA